MLHYSKQLRFLDAPAIHGCPALPTNNIVLEPDRNIQPGLVNGAATHVTTSTHGTNEKTTPTERDSNGRTPAYIAFPASTTPKRKQVCVCLLWISL